MENKDVYEVHQNIYVDLTKWADYVKNGNYPNDRDKNQFSMIIDTQIGQTFPRAIKVVNLDSNIFTVNGYCIEVNFKNIFQSPCYIYDNNSIQPFKSNYIYLGGKKQVQQSINLTLRRISGPAYDNNEANVAFIGTPILTFGIVYEYYSV